MKKNYIWDTGAITLFFADHVEAKNIMKQIEKHQSNGFIAQSIFLEYYYKTWQVFGKKTAQFRVALLRNSMNQEVFYDESDIFSIGRIKVDLPSLSLVDCIVVFSGIKLNATILTTDKLLESVKQANVLKFDY